MTHRSISILVLSSAFAACSAEPDGSGSPASRDGPGEPVASTGPSGQGSGAAKAEYTSTSFVVMEDGSVVTEVVPMTEQDMLAGARVEQLLAAGVVSSVEEAREQAVINVSTSSGCWGDLRLYSGTNYNGNKVCLTWSYPQAAFPHTNRVALPSGFTVCSWAMNSGFEVVFGQRCPTIYPYEPGVDCSRPFVKYDPSCDQVLFGGACGYATTQWDPDADDAVRQATQVKLEPGHYNSRICGAPSACHPIVVQ